MKGKVDVIYSIRKPYTDMIFAGTKPIEFRKKIPTKLEIGSKIFIYETKYKDGIGKIKGVARVKAIEQINKGNQPSISILSHYYLTLFGTEEEKEFYKENINLLNSNESLYNRIKRWGEEIGFYNKNGTSDWKYLILLDNPVLFNFPKPINKFKTPTGKIIEQAPQSYCYVNSTQDFLYLKTKQSAEVAKILETADYYASFKRAGFKKEYKYLMNLLDIDKTPIFAVETSLNKSQFLGNLSNDCTIYLKVPVEECRMMEYYSWTDVMFYLNKGFDEDLKICKNNLMDELNYKLDTFNYEMLQVILTSIKKDWVQKIEYSIN